MVADNVTEPLDGQGIDLALITSEGSVKLERGQLFIVTEPEPPVKVLDGLVPTFNDFVNGSVALLRVVGKGKVERDRSTSSLLVHDERHGVSLGVESELDSLEVSSVRTERPSCAVDGDRDSLAVLRLDHDSLARSGVEDSPEGVGDVASALDDVNRGQSSTKPANVGTRNNLEPVIKSGDVLADLEGPDVARDGLGNETSLGLTGFGADKVNLGNLALVIVVELLQDLLDQESFNVTKHVLDGFVNNSSVLDGHGALEDTDPLGVLVEDGFNIFGSPERVLLEPHLKVVVEDRDERDGLLAGSLTDGKEEGLVLGSDKLRLGSRVRVKERLDSRQGLVEVGEGLEKRLLGADTINASEPLFDTPQPVADKVSERNIDPPILLGDVHQSDHSPGNLLVSHLANVGNDSAVRLLAEPRLVKVLVKPVNDIVTLVLEPSSSLLPGLGKDGVVKLSPELDTSGGNLVDRLAELGSDGEDTTGGPVVGTFPLGVVNTGSVNDELLDGSAGVSFLGDHDSGSVKDTVEGHGLETEHLDGPFTGKAVIFFRQLGEKQKRKIPKKLQSNNSLRPDVFGTTETGTGNQANVGVLPDRRVSSDDGLVEVFTRVVTTGTTTSPLHDDGVVRVGDGNVDDLPDTFNGSGLEGNMLDTGLLEGGDNFSRLLRGGDTGSDTETFDRETFLAHLLPERELEGELSLVDVQSVERDTNSGLDSPLDFSDLGSEGLGVVVTTTGKFNVVAGVKSGSNKVGANGGRSHTGDHDGRLTEQSGEGSVNVDLAVKRLDELGGPFLGPNGLTSDLGSVVELGGGLALFANDDNPDTSAFNGTASKRPDTTVTTGSKVDSVGGS